MASDSFYQAYVDILPSTKGLRKAISDEMGSAGTEGGRSAGEGIRGGILGSIGGLAAPIAGAVAALGIGSAIKDSINNASDFSESASAVQAVFGDASQTIQDFAKTSATTLGQSTNDTLAAAQTFGIFGKAAGLTGDDLSGFTTDFLGLSADLASFNNTTPEQAIEALGAGLRGESEPLRSYGVLLDDATLKARAMQLGISSGTAPLTQQQKVLAAQAEILAQTGTQQGDFAKTSGGLANQQRILAAGLENLSTTLGQIFLPIVLAVVGFLNRSFIPVLQDIVAKIIAVKDILTTGDFTTAFADAFHVSEDSSIVGFFLGIRDGFNGLKSFIVDGDFTGAFARAFHVDEDSPLVDFLFTMRDAVKDVFSSIGPVLGQIGAAFAPVFAQIGPILGSLIPQLIDLYTSFSPLGIILDAIIPLLPQIASLFGELAGTLGGLLGDALTTLLPVVSDLAGTLSSVLGGVIATLIPVVLNLVKVLGPVLAAVISAVLPVVAQLAGVIGPILTGVIDALLPIVVLLANTFAQILPVILTLIEPLLSLVSSVLPLLGIILVPIAQLLGALLPPIIGLIAPLVNLLVPILSFLVTILGYVVGALVNAIAWFVNLVTGVGDSGNQLSTVVGQIGGMFADFFTNTVGMFVDFFTNTVGMFVDFGTNVWNAVTLLWATAGQIFSDGVNTVVGFVQSIPDTILGILGGLGGLLVDSGKALIQGFIDGITGAIGGIGDAVGGVMDFVGGFFPHSPAKRGPFSGSGWRAIGSSGAAVMDAFTGGMGNPQVALGVSAPMVNLASVRPTVDPSVSRATSQAQAPAGNTYVTNLNAVRDQTAAEIVQLGQNAQAQKERMAV